MIGFNKPYLTGKETEYIKEAVMSGKISGDGIFTKKCHQFFEQKYGFRKALLTTSCTDALEMAAILLDIKEGDEIIVPSYTFVSTVNAFMLRGAKIVFVDSGKDNPNIDVELIEKLITPNTKAIVPVHYAGIACNMDKIMALANKYHLFVVEDAAQAIDSFYKGKPLGSIGHLAAFSFHETKNIISGEGGMLVINDERFVERAEIIREKGTNRSAFFRGEIDKYGWVDIGSSFLPSDIIAAFLYAQIENLDDIQNKRKHIWNTYYNSLRHLEETGRIKLPSIPDYATNNAHMFYIICSNVHERSDLIKYLKENDINVVFHYLSLHKSPFYIDKHDGREMPVSDELTDCLVRLPFYYELTQEQQKIIIRKIKEYYYDKN
ncbi:dTDP-4-amino-4,6-dideoxygalactose transaminase [uncultured Chryseobacterium sp.]|uniref:dTDP-4-amino-4,6-dideoxygalactose transaminase n=1 Tax=uncultured Chryseobacterium sp. TaxID=259322 RepID=UPI0025DCEDE4|nr:dTDP-4-amino-4,6-dideoxygalactose transaminase [uncultured Chryseobacterium sp.]